MSRNVRILPLRLQTVDLAGYILHTGTYNIPLFRFFVSLYITMLFLFMFIPILGMPLKSYILFFLHFILDTFFSNARYAGIWANCTKVRCKRNHPNYHYLALSISPDGILRWGCSFTESVTVYTLQRKSQFLYSFSGNCAA